MMSPCLRLLLILRTAVANKPHPPRISLDLPCSSPDAQTIGAILIEMAPTVGHAVNTHSTVHVHREADIN